MRRDRRTEVTFEIKAFKVTAACASGCTECSHLEMPQYRVKLLLPDADYSLAEIRVEQILLEDELPIDQMQAQERSAGSSPRGSLKAVCRKRSCSDNTRTSKDEASSPLKMSGTSSDGTDEDDQGETHFFDSLPPRGIRSSGKRPKKERWQLPARKNTKTAEAEKETLILEISSCRNQAELAGEETAQSWIPTPLGIVIFAIFVFVIFMRVTNGG